MNSSYTMNPFSGNCSGMPSLSSGHNFEIAMAYVPWQQPGTLYDADKGLSRGTLFPELDKPFLGRRAFRR